MESIQNDNETISLKKIIVGYLYHWKLFLFTACLSLIPAILYLALYPKTYEFMSRIRMQGEKELGGGESFGLGDASGLIRSFGLAGKSGGAVNVGDEIATLSSNWLLKNVVIKLGLNVAYEKPYSFVQLYEDSPLLVVPDSLTQEELENSFSFKIAVKKDGSANLKIKETGEKYTFASLPAQLKIPEGTFNISYRESVDIEKPFTLNVSVFPAGRIAENLSNAIEVEEFSKISNTLELTYTDYSKMRGKDLLNVLMDEYNKNAEVIKKDEGYKAMTFLDGRIAGAMQELNTIERTIEAYKIKNKMTDIEYDVRFYADAVKNLREKIIDLEAQSHVIDLLDAYVKDPKNKYNLIPAMISSSDGEKGGSAITTYNEALIARDKLQKTSKSNNPLSEVADSQIDKLRESVVLAIDNARKSTQYVLSDLKSQEKTIMDKMGSVPTYEREYLDYSRQKEVLQGVYLFLLQKKEAIALTLGQDRDRGFIVDTAFVKHKPIAPRKLYAGLFVILFTLIVPVGFLFCKEQLLALMDEYKNSRK
ncbi:MAG: tyrosine protein kinase [Parabacteroides sp.]|nr:tyrosine protein kinase [Parabacteroides sp.]